MAPDPAPGHLRVAALRLLALTAIPLLTAVAAAPPAGTTPTASGKDWPCPTAVAQEDRSLVIDVAALLGDERYRPDPARGRRVFIDGLPPGARWAEARGEVSFRPTFIQGGRRWRSHVTAVSDGNERGTDLCIEVEDTIAPPPPRVVATEARGDHDVLVLSQVTDDYLDSPGNAGRTFEAVVAVPYRIEGWSVPVRVDLHGFASPRPPGGAPGYFALYPHDPDNTYWWGYSSALPEGQPDACDTPDYTLRRVLHLLEWLLARYPAADEDRVYVTGNSMGGAGAATMGLRYARHFAFALERRGQLVPRNHRPARRSQLESLWGRAESVEGEDCLTPWDDGDLTELLHGSNEARQQLLFLYHGKDDATVHFGALVDPSPLTGLSFVETLRQLRVGHRVVWDESSHARPDPLLGRSWWSKGWHPGRDPVTYVRRDLAFPAFTAGSLDGEIGDHLGNGARPRDPSSGFAGRRKVAGDTGWDGDVAGAWNRYPRWLSDEIVDRHDRFEIPLRIATGEGDPPPAPGYPPTGERLEAELPATIDVTPRRLQAFQLVPGEAVRWAFGDRSGVVITDDDGTVTVQGLALDAEWRVLVLERDLRSP